MQKSRAAVARLARAPSGAVVPAVSVESSRHFFAPEKLKKRRHEGLGSAGSTACAAGYFSRFRISVSWRRTSGHGSVANNSCWTLVERLALTRRPSDCNDWRAPSMVYRFS